MFQFCFQKEERKVRKYQSYSLCARELNVRREVMSTFLFLNGRNDETTIVVYRWIVNNHGNIHELVIRHSIVLLIKSANIIVEWGLGP